MKTFERSHRANRLRRRSRHRHVSALESLEQRVMLSGDNANVFARLLGRVDAAGTTPIPFQLHSSDFTTTRGSVVLGFQVSAGSEGEFNPAAAQIRNAAGSPVPLSYTTHDIRNAADSLIIADLVPGTYTLNVTGQGGSVGDFEVLVRLVGDLDGDRDVDTPDRNAYIALSQARAHSVVADANRDGYLTSFDYAQLIRNLGSRTSVAPLTLTAALDPAAAATLPDGTPLTGTPHHDVVGVTRPGAVVEVDADQDGTSDASQTADGSGNYRIPVTLSEGVNLLQVQAADRFGQTRTTTIGVALDTLPPELTLDLAPESDSAPVGDQTTTFEVVTLEGVTEPGLTVSLYRGSGPSPAIASTTADSAGRYAFDSVSLALGSNMLSVTATDAAGNTGLTQREFIRRPLIELLERTDFTAVADWSITIPAQPSHLKLTWEQLHFDESASGINDAFEIALVAADGRSLVHTHSAASDAAFNITEGEQPAAGINTLHTGSAVEIDLAHIVPGTTATVIARLVNNDADTTTSVRIVGMDVLPGTLGTPIGVVPAGSVNTSQSVPDMGALSDITGSLNLRHRLTSLNDSRSKLLTAVEIVNAGQFEVARPLLAVIENLSDPRVQVRDFDGRTPDGRPYFDFSDLISGDRLNPGHNTGLRELAFFNPEGIQFDFSVRILGQLNRDPVITSLPDVEALTGRGYQYDVNASDADGDAITYSLAMAPSQVSIDPQTGVITWQPESTDIGNHTVVVRADDGRGGIAEQSFVLAAITPPPNRPPIFTSTPVVSASVGSPYIYDVDAVDADGDTLTYSLSAPAAEYEEVVVEDDPVGYWRLGDALPTVAEDSSGNELHGQYVGTPTLGIAGALADNTNSAARFTGGSLVTVADHPALRPSQITLEAWVRPASLPAWASIVMKSSSGNWSDGYGLAHYTGSNDVHFFVNNYGSVQVSGNIPLNAWSHVVGTYDGTHLRLFINGVLAGELPYNGAIAHSTAPLHIGSGSGGYPWNGDLDEVAIYDSALSADQVLEHFELGQNGSQRSRPPHGMTIDETTGVISWTPASEQLGMHEAAVYVTDGRGAAASQYWTVKVQPATGNHAPVIVSEPPAVITGKRFEYQVVGLDPDGDALTYSLVSGPTGMTIDPGTGLLSLSATTVAASVHVRVADGRGGFDDQEFALEFMSPGGEISGRVFSADYIEAHGRIVVAHDVNTLSPSIAGMEESRFAVNVARWLTRSDSGQILEIAPSTTDYRMHLAPGVLSELAAAGFAVTTTDRLEFTLSDLKSFDAVFVGLSWPSLRFFDNNILGDYVKGGGSVYIVGGVDNDAQFEASGWSTFLGSFGIAYEGEYNNVYFTPIASQHPIFAGISGLVAGRGQFILDLEPDNPENQILVSYAGDGVFAAFDPTPRNGLVDWVVYIDENQNGERDSSETYAQSNIDGSYAFPGLPDGTYTVRHELKAGWSLVDANDSFFVVTIAGGQEVGGFDFGHVSVPRNKNNAPAFVSQISTGMRTVKSGELFRYDAVAFDADFDPLVFDIPAGAPGMVVDSRSGIVVWEPTTEQLGVHDVILSVRDGHGGVALQAFEITVEAANSSPVITSTPPATAVIGETFSYSVLAQDADEDALTYLLNLGPAGMVIDSATGLISWTPSDPPPGLVSHYPMEGVVADIAGGNNPAAASGLLFVPGRAGSGVSLAPGGYIEIPHSASLANQRFSLEAWVRPDGPGPNNDEYGSVILQKGLPWLSGGTGDAPLSLWWSALDNRFRFGFGNIFTDVVVSTRPFLPDQFHHVVATYDGAVFRLFVNGALEGQLALARSITYEPTVPWTIGSTFSDARNGGFPRTFNGVIDEVGIYDRPLNTGEIEYRFRNSGGTYEVSVMVDDGRGGFDKQDFALRPTDQPADLTISDVDQSGLVFDGQRLTVAGPITARITNFGPRDVTTPFRVTFFEDRNGNNTLEPDTDNVLGKTSVTESLPVNGSVTVSNTISGSALFTNNRIWAMVDSEDSIEETDETNNLAVRIIAPELTASYVRSDQQGTQTAYTVRLGNGGSLHVAAGVNVAFYDGDPRSGGALLGVVASSRRIDPGDFEDLTLTLLFPALDLWVNADDSGTGLGTVNEGDETNNLYHPDLGIQPGEIRGSVFYEGPVVLVDAPTDLNDPGTVDWGVLGSDFTNVAHPFTLPVPELPGLTVTVSKQDPAPFERRDQGTGFSGNFLPGERLLWTRFSGDDITLTFNQPIRGVGFTIQEDFNSFPSPPLVNRGPFTASIEAFDVNLNRIGAFTAVGSLTNANDGSALFVGVQSLSSSVGIHRVVVRMADDNSYSDFVIGALQVSEAVSQAVVYLDQNQNGIRDPGERFALTDADGSYAFADIPPATYFVTQEPKPGWRMILPDDGVHEVGLVSGDVAGERDFVIVHDPDFNFAPVFASLPTTVTVPIGRRYTYDADAVDFDGDALTFVLDTAPAGMTVDGNGLVSWTPLITQPRLHPVVLRVHDGRGGEDIQEFTIEVEPRSQNRPPEVVSLPPGVVTAASRYAYNPAAADPDGDPLVWSLATAPRGMSIDAERGFVRWTPGPDQLGIHPVELLVRDGQGGSATQRFSIEVRALNTPPLITSTPPTVSYVGKPFVYEVAASDIDGDVLTYSLAGPDGMTIDPATGVIRWTPAQAQIGIHEPVIVVSDGQRTTTQVFEVHVLNEVPNSGPTFTSRPTSAAAIGTMWEYQAVAVDPENDGITFLLQAAPAGMLMDLTSGLIQWTPTSGQVGSHSVRVVAVDSHGAGAIQTFTLNARVNSPPVFVSAPVLSAAAGALYRYDVQASDPNGDRIAWRLASGPQGMSIDALGRIQWPTSLSGIGTHPVEIVITDTFGATAVQAFDLNVVADTQLPKVSIAFTANPVHVGDDVSIILSATDNVGVVALLLTVDGLPVVLDALGQATIPASATGAFSVVATAIDAAGNQRLATDTLLVIDPSVSGQPIVDITSPSDFDQITSRVTVHGTVDDPDLLFWSLSYAPVEAGAFVEFARGTSAILNGVLGTFDPSLLSNDEYILELRAVDSGGNESVAQRVVSVAGDLKIGNFTVSFTDLTIPVSGIPITLSRTYDSLNAQQSGDLGFGWRLELKDTDLRTSVAKTGAEEDLIYNPYFDGARVYVTLPGGRREGFTFRITPAPGLANRILGIHQGQFVPDAGVYSTLSTQQFQLRVTSDGEALDYATGLPFNPASPVFGGTLTLTTQEGIQYTIDGNTGDLETVADRNGNTLTFSAQGIVSSAGTGVTFERDAQGRITAVVDPLGARIRYEYDALGDLVAVTDREGHRTQLVYAESSRPHFLTEIIDPLGRSGIRSQYDDQGRLIRMVDADGHNVEMVHNPDNFVETVLDQLGNPTTYEYDTLGNVVTEIDAAGTVTRRAYGDPNNPTLETAVTVVLGDGTELITQYTYDARGNVRAETDPLGNVTYFTFDAFDNVLATIDPLGNTTTNTYDGRGNLLTMTDAAGTVTRFTYDSSGNPLVMELPGGNTQSFVYDGFGRVLEQTDALGHVVQFSYDSNGNQLTETRTQSTPGGFRTIVTQRDYDASGRVRFVRHIENGVTPVRAAETRYDAVGNRIEEIDVLGRSTRFVYDDRGLLTFTIRSDDTAADDSDNPRTQTEYDAAGRAVAQIDELGRRMETVYDNAGRVIAMIYPDATPEDATDNPRTWTEYDAAGRSVAQIDELGNRTEFVYDLAGRQIEVILPDETPADLSDNPRLRTEYDAAGRSVAQADPLGTITRFVYDAAGRPVETIYADGTNTVTVIDAAGRLVQRIDQAGLATDYEYDALGRLTAVILPEVDDPISGLRVRPRTEYEYDELGGLTVQRDALDRETRYEYDGRGRRMATILPLGQRSTSEFDDAGRVLSTTDFNGDTIEFLYNAENQLIAKEFPDGTSVSFTYTIAGQRESYTDARGTTSWAYDERGRLLERIDPDGVSIAYSYDAAGNRTSVTIPSGTTSYTFDAQNRLETVTDPEDGVTRYRYDLAGRPTETIFPNGVIESREYDELHRLLFLESRDSGGTVFDSYRYLLDATGNRTRVEEASGRAVDYVYDELYRLVGEWIDDDTNGDRGITYVYDQVGNRLERDDSAEGITTYTYDDNDRLLTETLAADVTRYTWDDNGNTLSKEGPVDQVFYEWDFENRLIGADTDGDGTIDVINHYDADGIRVSQTVNGDETRFLIDTVQPYAQVLEEYTPGGIIKVTYVHGNDLISQNRHGETGKSFYHVDGLGSTRALTDSAEVMTDRYVYEAFGRTIGQVGVTENVYLFAGEQRDASLGVDYLRARYFGTDAGRLLSRDSFDGFRAEPLSIHDYVYANADPITHIDPSGHSALRALYIGVIWTTWFAMQRSMGGESAALSPGQRAVAMSAIVEARALTTRAMIGHDVLFRLVFDQKHSMHSPSILKGYVARQFEILNARAQRMSVADIEVDTYTDLGYRDMAIYRSGRIVLQSYFFNDKGFDRFLKGIYPSPTPLPTRGGIILHELVHAVNPLAFAGDELYYFEAEALSHTPIRAIYNPDNYRIFAQRLSGR